MIGRCFGSYDTYNIVHFETSNKSRVESLHKADNVRSTSEFVSEMRIIEFLHDLKLQVRLLDISVHEEALCSSKEVSSKIELATELKLAS